MDYNKYIYICIYIIILNTLHYCIYTTTTDFITKYCHVIRKVFRCTEKKKEIREILFK